MNWNDYGANMNDDTSKTRKTKKPLGGYEILLCLTGGIACYKSADLTSKLVQAGAGVSVAMTDSACQFIRPLSFQALTQRPVYTSLWQSSEASSIGHLSLTESADLMIIAPATANILAKMAGGIADDLVSTLALSAFGACPIFVAPAMNERMWNAPPTQENLQRLKSRGVEVFGPGEGLLACGGVGLGRMAEPKEILHAVAGRVILHPPKSAGG